MITTCDCKKRQTIVAAAAAAGGGAQGQVDDEWDD
jgi:hypothetical protein